MVKLLVIIISFVVATYSSVIDEVLEKIDFFSHYSVPDPAALLTLRSRRSTLDRIKEHGYPVEHHYVVTEDDYILGVFRIPYSHNLKNKNEVRPIAFLMHGLTCCSDIWILSGPENGLPYLLADAGYDVWLGNARGTIYSRNHTTRSTDHPDFWKFSWHEIGYYDVAAMIDYALNTDNALNQNETLHYVGHSQGTTAFFVLMSSRPEYNKKIKTAHMFAPIAIMKNLPNSPTRKLATYLGHYNAYSRMFSAQEFYPKTEFLLELTSSICAPGLFLHYLCEIGVKLNFDKTRVNMTILPELLSTHPAGCSSNQVLHYMQEMESGRFCQYDYCKKKNIEIYGTEQPPDYPVELITSKVHMWYGDNDDMAAVKDVLALAKRLPNKELHRVEDPLWDHRDFVLNWKIRIFLNVPAMEIMDLYEYTYEYE